MKTLIILLIALIVCNHHQGQANQITVSGHYLKDEIKKAAFFYSHLLGVENANILIQCSPFLSKNINGYTLYEENTEFNLKNVLIRINNQQHFSAILITLAHEMIHAKQFLSGQLKHHHKKHYSWKDKDFFNIEHISYPSREWEKEALNEEGFLYEQYKNAKKNQDTFPYSY